MLPHTHRTHWASQSFPEQKTSGCFGFILGRTKMLSTPFLHLKCAKWNTADGADGGHGAPEMQPQAAAWSLVSLPDRLRLPQSLYLGCLLLWGHLRRDENYFDPFFSPKMRKMEHGSRSRWSSRSRGNATTGGCADARSTRAGGQDYDDVSS